MLFQLVACGGGGGGNSSPTPVAPAVVTNPPSATPPPPIAVTPVAPPTPTAPVSVPCGNGTFAPVGYTSTSQCKIGLTVLPKNVQMLHPGELRFKFSDLDGNERTRTFTYSNGQTSTNILTAVNGTLGEIVPGATVTLEGPKGTQNFPAISRGSSGFTIDIPVTFTLNYATNYTITVAGFSPYWGADAIMIDAQQKLSFKTVDTAFLPQQTCGLQGNSPCLLTAALCTWDSPCVLGTAKQNYYFENPANTMTFGLLENNYLGTASSGTELVFKATGVSVGIGYKGGGFARSNITEQRVETVRFSKRGDIYIDTSNVYKSNERCYRASWASFNAWGFDTAYLNGLCATYFVPASDWIIPAGRRIDRTCTLAQRCVITNDAHYVNDPATNFPINGEGWSFSRSFGSLWPGSFSFRKYWLDIGPKPSPTTSAPNDPTTFALNKLGLAKNAFWVKDELYIQTDSGACFHLNQQTFAACPM